ncbi:helix-turn-helix domain-containing protein [Paenibacillus algorifonticola]|uniref:helix-turn-helix domain-containing protein n=1 Tax=Paenibacillus algorifonticola TaxID=684063 RepID=UPI003D29C5A9
MKKLLYQVLIVDDEYYFRQLLIQLIDWEALGSSYLSHIFKKEKGQSFTEYLTNIRLDKAIELLNGVSSDGLMSLKVVDVSMKVGYTDPYYFSKCFKKKFGIVPSKTIRG